MEEVLLESASPAMVTGPFGLRTASATNATHRVVLAQGQFARLKSVLSAVPGCSVRPPDASLDCMHTGMSSAWFGLHRAPGRGGKAGDVAACAEAGCAMPAPAS